MKQKNGIYYLLLIFAVCFWGVSFVFTKSLLGFFTPISLLFFRLLFASAILCLLCLIFFYQPLREVKAKDWLNLFGLSLFEPFLYFIFETYSLRITDATVVSVIIATIPIFTLFLSVLYFKERMSGVNIAGVFLSAIGILVMLFPDFVNAIFNVNGILLAFGAVFSSVGYSFFLNRVDNRYHPVFIVACQNTIGLFLFLPMFLLMHKTSVLSEQWHLLFQPQVLLQILPLAIFCSSLAFIFYVISIQKVGLGRACTFTNLIPIVTAVCSYFVIDEQFTLIKIIGTVIAVVGVGFVQYSSKRVDN